MRIALPASQSDVHLLANWIEVVKHLRCGEQHDLTIVASRSVEVQAHDAKTELEGCFNSVTVSVIPIDPSGGWPRGSNAHFWHCANFMSSKPNLPWLLNELDCLPTSERSYDIVAAKHMDAGTPFSGQISPTPFRETNESGEVAENGRIVSSIYGANDTILNGCAVYPGNIMGRSGTGGLMNDFMKGDESPDIGWDIYLRAGIKAEGVSHIDAIANHWNTENYRVEGGRLVCDSRKTHPAYADKPKWQIRQCGGAIHPDAVLIHGCKDESLSNLILENKIPQGILRSAPKRSARASTSAEQAFPQVEQFERPEVNAEVVELRGKVDKLTELLERVLTNVVAPQSNGNGRHAPEPAEVARPASTDDGSDILRVLGVIPDGKKVKLGTISEKTNIPPNRLRAIIAANQALFTPASGPASWIGKATPPPI